MPKVTQLIAGRIWYLKPDLSNPKSHALSPGLHSLSNKDLSSIYYVHTTALKHFGQVVLSVLPASRLPPPVSATHQPQESSVLIHQSMSFSWFQPSISTRLTQDRM